ncbi:MAG: DNA repair protein RecN [Oscillospiraceae bacterium]|nr:DNA repair protein RecN [Oscillospiraceae bacterium]
MLTNLCIENIAVIEKTEIEFADGMCVLTGETGAGKSMIIDSVNIISGARTNKSLVRYGTDKASVTAVFDVGEGFPYFEELGIDAEDGQIIIRRDITADGKSVCRINSAITPLSTLRAVAQRLVNIHGQPDNQNLLNPAKHIEFLDKFAGNGSLLEEYGVCYGELADIKRKIKELDTDEKERAEKIDFLTFQVGEIENAKLKKGEDELLEEQRAVISNAEKISLAVNTAYGNLYDSSEIRPAYDGISIAVSALEDITEYDTKIQAIYDKLSGIMYDLEDCTRELNDYARGVEYDENMLDEIEGRLDLINRLKMKYGGTTEAVLEFCENAKKALENITHGDELKAELKAEYEKKLAELSGIAAKLTASRKKAGEVLRKEIERSMHELDMKGAGFCVDIKNSGDFSPTGRDEVEFLISANAGEPLKPLVKTASGGELSRVMLSIKSILADVDDVDTLIFDEIDTGVSGSAAQKIASKLSHIAHHRQVICITHLASVAAMADAHYLIQKKVKDGKTSTSLKRLDHDNRVCELARIIDGSDITEAAVRHAAEMLSHAEKMKK